jgi:hypothetical protein
MKNYFALLFVLFGLNASAQNEDVIDYLNASEFNGKVLLSWSILQGNTCNGVQVLHSLDSVNFTQIGSIEGICGSTLESIEYEFTDISPEKNAINYYRLSLGGIGFSWIVNTEVIDLGANASLIRPNPINETAELHFDNDTSSEMWLNVYSDSGVLIHTESTTSELFILQKGDFSPGIYFYHIRQEGFESQVKGKFVVD